MIFWSYLQEKYLLFNKKLGLYLLREVCWHLGPISGVWELCLSGFHIRIRVSKNSKYLAVPNTLGVYSLRDGVRMEWNDVDSHTCALTTP